MTAQPIEPMTMSDEEWRPVEGWPYEVSNLGRVRRDGRPPRTGVRPHRICNGVADRRGYIVIQLADGPARRKAMFAHQLVARAFIGPPPSDKHVVAHWDGVPSNNRVENLRWATNAENCLDTIRHGRVHESFGAMSTTNKLSEAQVRDIRRRHSAGEAMRALARAFPVGLTQVRHIVHRRSWAWLPDDPSQDTDRRMLGAWISGPLPTLTIPTEDTSRAQAAHGTERGDPLLERFPWLGDDDGDGLDEEG